MTVIAGATSDKGYVVPDLGFVATVPTLLSRAVDEFAAHDLVVLADRRISYAEAEQRSALLARRLIELGAGKGSRVAMLYPSSPEFVVAFLAIARIGAVAVMLSSTSKAAELNIALRLSDAQILLAPARLLGRDFATVIEDAVSGLAESGPTILLPAVPYLRHVLLDGVSDRSWVTAGPANTASVSSELLAAAEAEVHPSDELLVIWTSGSTADPKGVVHTHGAAVRKVSPDVGLGLRPSRPGRIFMTMPLFWVGGPQSLLGCLHSGATLLCQERFDAAAAVDLICSERADAIAGWRFMMDRLRAEPRWAEVPTDKLEPPRTAPLSSRGDPMNLGMTETLGMHLPGEYFDYKIVDPETGEEVPQGHEGEFRVRGMSLMSRMYKREREETFDHDGFYRTGDKGYLEDGHVYFTGRYSEVIKSAGANVSPQEVEAVLEAFPEVQTAVVFGAPHPDRGQEVVAVVGRRDGAVIDESEIIDRCRKVLSGFKVPARVHLLAADDLPMLSSGKPDRRTIRAGQYPST